MIAATVDSTAATKRHLPGCRADQAHRREPLFTPGRAQPCRRADEDEHGEQQRRRHGRTG